MKLKSLVIADYYAAVNKFLDLVHTARHTLEVSSILNNVNNLIEILKIKLGIKLLQQNQQLW